MSFNTYEYKYFIVFKQNSLRFTSTILIISQISILLNNHILACRYVIYENDVMKIAITGSGGFIGSRMSDHFVGLGIDVLLLHASDFKALNVSDLSAKLEGCDVIINLAGASVGRRWSRHYKREIRESRVMTTRLLVDAVNAMTVKPEVFISASATGFYPSGKKIRTESDSAAADSFLGSVCRDWEREAMRVDRSMRLVISRFGVVLSADGGALVEMLKPFRMGIATQIGRGDQYFSWIYIDDLIQAMYFVINCHKISGICNFTAPESPTNARLTRLIVGILRTPLYIVLPKSLMRLILGERSVLLFDSQRVMPKKLLDSGYVFHYPSIRRTLERILSSNSLKSGHS